MNNAKTPPVSKREVRLRASARLSIRSFSHTRAHGPRRAWKGVAKQWRLLRRVRVHRFSWALRKSLAKTRLERYGLDVTGRGATDERRKLRNARKQERRAN